MAGYSGYGDCLVVLHYQRRVYSTSELRSRDIRCRIRAGKSSISDPGFVRGSCSHIMSVSFFLTHIGPSHFHPCSPARSHSTLDSRVEP